MHSLKSSPTGVRCLMSLASCSSWFCGRMLGIWEKVQKTRSCMFSIPAYVPLFIMMVGLLLCSERHVVSQCDVKRNPRRWLMSEISVVMWRSLHCVLMMVADASGLSLHTAAMV